MLTASLAENSWMRLKFTGCQPSGWQLSVNALTALGITYTHWLIGQTFFVKSRTPCGIFKLRVTASRLFQDNLLEKKQLVDGGQAGKKKSLPRLFFVLFFLFVLFHLPAAL